jgi:hypothetical protein
VHVLIFTVQDVSAFFAPNNKLHLFLHELNLLYEQASSHPPRLKAFLVNLGNLVSILLFITSHWLRPVPPLFPFCVYSGAA